MENNKKINRYEIAVLSSCFLAGVLEVYDFMIFAFLNPVLQKNYLNFLPAYQSEIIGYLLFAVAFFFRPLGSILFGYIGDRGGRKIALVLSVTMMGLAALTMFTLPPFESIGILACYIIALVRIVQGLSMGGEYSGAIIYAIEHFPINKRGIVGAIVVSGCLIGASLARIITNYLQSPDMPEYAWRFAFLIGFCLSIVGFFIRNKLKESPEFLFLQNTKKFKLPIIQGIKNYPLEFLAGIFLIGVNGVTFYFVVVYLPNYLNKVIKYDISNIMILTTIVPAMLAPLMGYLSDKWDRGKLLNLGILAIGVYGIIVFPILIKDPTYIKIALVIFGYSVLFSVQSGTASVYTVEIYPVECRYSCGALAYSIAQALIGGTTPLVAATIMTNSGNINYVFTYVSIIVLLGFILGTILVIKRSNNRSNERITQSK